MTDVELLPLYAELQGHPKLEIIKHYAHANVARAIAAKDAEIEALRAEVEKLRALAGCAYQMAGMHDAPLVWLDRLSEAANGDALPDADTLMDELLPYQPDAVCEAEARAERLAEALALLPDEIHMVEHNPDEGPLTFCCGREVNDLGPRGLLITHDEGCWYARMRALRDHDQEEK